MLNKATILERWPNKVLQLCHKWDHWSCLIIKITHFPSWLFYTFGSVFAFQNNNKDTKPQQSMALYFLFFLFSISSFQSKTQIILILHGETVPGTQLVNQMKKIYLQSAGGTVFAVGLCKHLIWICLMCTWNSKCQRGGRWVGMCSEAECLGTRETTK